jgi:hypothetical protein
VNLADYEHISKTLIDPCSIKKKNHLVREISRSKGFAEYLDGKLTLLENVPGLDSITKDIRNNPAAIDDFVSVLKVGAHYLSKGFALEFVPPGADKSPDIRIQKNWADVFVEVKRLVDDTKWVEIIEELQQIPSGYLVNMTVDFDLYQQQVKEIVERTRQALLTTGSAKNFDVDDYANITLESSGAVPANATAVRISSRVWSYVGDDEREREPRAPGEVTYGDLRQMFGSRLDKALEQLESVDGYRVVAFDIEHDIGSKKTLENIFIGTLKFRFAPHRGGLWFREQDGLFWNDKYSSVALALGFFGGTVVLTRNPRCSEAASCESLLL